MLSFLGWIVGIAVVGFVVLAAIGFVIQKKEGTNEEATEPSPEPVEDLYYKGKPVYIFTHTDPETDRDNEQSIIIEGSKKDCGDIVIVGRCSKTGKEAEFNEVDIIGYLTNTATGKVLSVVDALKEN